MRTFIGRDYQKYLNEKQLVLYCPLEVKEWSSATARGTAALTAVHARRQVGCAALAATGTASAARITVIEFECCGWVIYWVVKWLHSDISVFMLYFISNHIHTAVIPMCIQGSPYAYGDSRMHTGITWHMHMGIPVCIQGLLLIPVCIQGLHDK